MTVLLMLRSAAKKASAPSDKGISELNHTPHATAVYASRPALPPDSRNTRLQAACYALPALDFRQPIAPASWRSFAHPTSLEYDLRPSRPPAPSALPAAPTSACCERPPSAAPRDRHRRPPANRRS